MSRVEILNSGSLRLDGRMPLELRSLALHVSPEAPLLGISTMPGTSTQRPDGSARVQQGLTSVYATVYGPREASMRSHTLHDRANVDVDVNLEPWSGKDRRKRAKGDRCVAEVTWWKRGQEAVLITCASQTNGRTGCCYQGNL